MERVHVVIKGTVQGVGFRYSTQVEASQLDLTGYVRNLPDGTVEIIAEGPSQALNRLIDWTKQGPPSADVKRVEVSHLTASGEFSSFQVRR
jgi:acylphosphatase